MSKGLIDVCTVIEDLHDIFRITLPRVGRRTLMEYTCYKYVFYYLLSSLILMFIYWRYKSVTAELFT